MQLPGDAALAEAVDEPSRVPVVRLAVDWWGNKLYSSPDSDLSELLEDVEIERALTTDLPAETSLVDGYAIAKLTATVAGRRRGATLPLALRISPLRAEAAGYPHEGRSEVQCDLGLRTGSGIRAVRQFTGVLSATDTDSDGRVKLTALDPSDGLRAPITLPTWMQLPDRSRSLGNLYDINSQWVIDYILRRCGVYASPPARTDAQVVVTGHGSAIAEVGFDRPPRGDARFNNTMDGANGAPEGPLLGSGFSGGMWVDGPFGMLAHRGSFGRNIHEEHYSRNAYEALKGTGVGFSAWVWCGAGSALDVPADAPAGTELDLFRVCPTVPVAGQPREAFRLTYRSDGHLTARVQDQTGSTDGLFISTGPTPGYRFVGVHFRIRGDGYVTITARVNGNDLTFTTSRAIAFANNDWYRVCEVDTFGRTAWACFQMWRADTSPVAGAGPWPGEVHTSQASIGRGLNHLKYLPSEVGRDALELLGDVAGAEFAFYGHDEDGRFFFRPRTSANTAAAPSVKKLNTATNVIDYGMRVSSDSIRNTVTLRTQIGYVDRKIENVLSFDDPDLFRLPPGTETFIDATLPPHVLAPLGDSGLSYPLGDPGLSLRRYDLDEWQNGGSSAASGYCPTLALSATPVFAGLNVVVRVNILSTNMIRIRVYNNTAYTIRLAAPTAEDGDFQGALRIGGYKLNLRPEETTELSDTFSVFYYGRRTLPLEPSQWRQNPTVLTPVAQALLDDLAKPIATLTDVEIVSDPRLQLGDVVDLVDPQGVAPLVRGRLVKLNRKAGRSRPVTETVAIRPFASTWPT